MCKPRLSDPAFPVVCPRSRGVRDPSVVHLRASKRSQPKKNPPHYPTGTEMRVSSQHGAGSRALTAQLHWVSCRQNFCILSRQQHPGLYRNHGAGFKLPRAGAEPRLLQQDRAQASSSPCSRHRRGNSHCSEVKPHRSLSLPPLETPWQPWEGKARSCLHTWGSEHCLCFPSAPCCCHHQAPERGRGAAEPHPTMSQP